MFSGVPGNAREPAFTAGPISSLALAGGNECWREFTGLEGEMARWLTGESRGIAIENDLNGKEQLFARFYSSECPDAAKRPCFTVNTVRAAPEPLSCALFLTGGAALAFVRKKRPAV